MNGFVSPELRIIAPAKLNSVILSEFWFGEGSGNWGEGVGDGSGDGVTDSFMVEGVVVGRFMTISVVVKMLNSRSTRTGLLFSQLTPFFSKDIPPICLLCDKVYC